VIAESSVLRINICGKKPTHRKSANRYRSENITPMPFVSTIKNRTGNTEPKFLIELPNPAKKISASQNLTFSSHLATAQTNHSLRTGMQQIKRNSTADSVSHDRTKATNMLLFAIFYYGVGTGIQAV